MACVCPFIACGLALGTIFWLGLRFGSILCVTPFLVLAIGVDDAYLMVNAWQGVLKRKRAAKKLDSGSKIATANDSNDSSNKLLAEEIFIEMIHEIGPSMTITSLTNVLAFTIGAFTPTPEIQLFSIGSAAAMACDYIYQFTFFGALMVIIGRYELAMETITSENESENDSSINTRKASFVEVLQRLRSQFKQVFRNWTSK
uniref:SSD domain-containing protein n=1 Tax=Acrobeloides nanus TaxID=290746 RepID=A0A914E9S9_9BILA